MGLTTLNYILVILAAVILKCSGQVSSLMCYDCLYTSSFDGEGKTRSAGNVNCRDPFYSDKITRVSCTGWCYKRSQDMGGGSVTYERGCSKDCQQTEGDASKTAARNVCCSKRYCNMAPRNRPAFLVWAMASLALIFLLHPMVD